MDLNYKINGLSIFEYIFGTDKKEKTNSPQKKEEKMEKKSINVIKNKKKKKI